jgi:MarR family transcriptional regulator, transcriptional regulator for hemolysin
MNKKHARSNSLVYLLERTLRFTRGALQQEFNANVKISVDQWLILQQVSLSPGSNQNDIAEACAKDPASVTRMLNLLGKKKLIVRKADKNDKRSYLLVVTPAGKKTLAQCHAAVDRFRKIAGKGISQEELNLLRKSLDKFFENCGGRI